MALHWWFLHLRYGGNRTHAGVNPHLIRSATLTIRPTEYIRLVPNVPITCDGTTWTGKWSHANSPLVRIPNAKIIIHPSLRLGLPFPQPSRRHHAQSLLDPSFHDPRTHHVLEAHLEQRYDDDDCFCFYPQSLHRLYVPFLLLSANVSMHDQILPWSIMAYSTVTPRRNRLFGTLSLELGCKGM